MRAETLPAFLTFLKTAPRAPSPVQLRSLAIATLAVAIVAGGWLRFAGLGEREMSADEGASWVAASAPTYSDVYRLQMRVNLGQHPLNELMLHAWMSEFGSSLPAMRALSAALGTLAILLVFLATRELLDIPWDRTIWPARAPASSGGRRKKQRALSADERFAIAALSALVFALNLVTIKYSHEARMYPLMLAASLAQVAFFLRAVRLGGLPNYVGVALFTGLSVAAHLLTMLLFGAEGLWLLYLWSHERWSFRTAQAGRVWRIAFCLAAGLAPLLPILRASIGANEAAVREGMFRWINMPAIWEPVALFNKATGSFAFPVMAVLGVWGAYRGWRRARGAVWFALLWMWAPVAMLMLISYTVTPVFVERYVLPCFVPFFILIAFGIWELPTNRARLGALALTAVLALGHIYSYDRKPHDFQWREAATIAASYVKAGQSIAVAPPYGVDVVGYYLRSHHGAYRLTRDSAGPDARVVIISRQGVPPKEAAALGRAYPRLIARLRGIKVRAR